MKNEQIIQQETEIINPSLVCDIFTGIEIDLNHKTGFYTEAINNSKEKVLQIIHETRGNTHKIMKKPNYFKCRDYIMESTKRSVNRIVPDKTQIIPKLAEYEKNESYTAYVKRIRGNKTIMN